MPTTLRGPTLLVSCVVFYAGCAPAYGTQYREVQVAAAPQAPPQQSLIGSDATTISDAEIHRILDATPSIPPRVRIALFHLSHESINAYGGTDPADMIMLTPRFVSTLQSSSIVYDASYLPPFLVAASPTLAQLREAAARYQADLVYLFATSCRLYPQYNLFSDDQAQAHCSADSAVLDVRTGLVPFVSRSGEDVTVRRRGKSKTYAMSETVRAAEIEGIDRSMQHNTELFTRFLMNARKPAESALVPSSTAPAQPH